MRSTSDPAGKSVWAAMSGGVDSSVTAAMMLDAGASVTGVTMRLAEEGFAPQHDAAIVAAANVCDTLGIAHRTLDVTAEFSKIVASAHDSRTVGHTPNPCIICNEHLKFGAFLRRCRELGADLVATGHYVRVVTLQDATLRLGRGVDPTKDQSYFLYRLGPDVLGFALFPLGGRLKKDVAEEAASRGLPVLEAESQDICIPQLFEYETPGRCGSIVDTTGRTLSTHDDATGFTVGQRKGLGIGGGQPFFVTEVDAASGTVTVGGRADIEKRTVLADDVVWWTAERALSCTAQIRYRGNATPAQASLEGGLLKIIFDAPVEAPAPGQSVVCYEDDTVIGGGIIASAS